MPRPDDLFQKISDHKFFTKLDMKSGFHQCRLGPDAQMKTTFWWGSKLYMYLRMPFGCKNAPAHFQELMEHELRDFHECAVIYIDDVLIHSATPEDHIRDVSAVLDKLKSVGMFAHPGKSIIGTKHVEYLGFQLSPGAISAHAAKTKAIRALRIPTTVSELRSVLGYMNYYRCFVPRFSTLAGPLNELLKSKTTNIKDKWTTTHDSAYAELKDALCIEGVALRIPDPTKQFYLHTDFSTIGISGILAQKDDEG
jgi:hypothetical protein